MSFSVIALGHTGQGLFDPDIMESRVSTRWLQSIPTISPTTDYIPLNITIGYPGGALTFRHKFALDSQLTVADFRFSPGWLQLCSRYIPGVTLRLSDGSSLSIPVPNPDYQMTDSNSPSAFDMSTSP